MKEIVLAAAPDLPSLPQPPNGRNAYAVFIAGFKNPLTKKTMKGCLATIADVIGAEDPADVHWHLLDYGHTNDIKAELGRKTTIVHGQEVPWSPATINKHLSALRGVLKTARRIGLMTADACENATDIDNDKGTRLPPGRSIAPAEQEALLRVCLDGSLAGYRDAALVATLLATGARRAEMAMARREHYDAGRRSMRIIGKGDKQREVYLNEDAAGYLGAWLSRTPATTGPLFCPVDRWGKVAYRHMAERTIAEIIDRVRRGAEIPPLTPHDFRRTFIGDLLDRGVDLVTVQDLVGHASPTTTGRYDRRPAAARKAAADRLSLPKLSDLLQENAR